MAQWYCVSYARTTIPSTSEKMLPTIVIHRALGVILPVPLPAVQLYPDIVSLCAQEGPQTSKWCGQSQPTVSDVWEPTRLLPGPRELPKRVPCARLSSALTCSSYVYDSLLRDTLGMCDTLGNGHSFSCHPWLRHCGTWNV